MRCRKNYRDLTPAERTRFVQALYHVKSTGLIDQYGAQAVRVTAVPDVVASLEAALSDRRKPPTQVLCDAAVGGFRNEPGRPPVLEVLAGAFDKLRQRHIAKECHVEKDVTGLDSRIRNPVRQAG